tara:strand:+ start:194 stop:481 length:288 start_codon:yes stop_codon:yes gene_type:complete
MSRGKAGFGGARNELMANNLEDVGLDSMNQSEGQNPSELYPQIPVPTAPAIVDALAANAILKNTRISQRLKASKFYMTKKEPEVEVMRFVNMGYV